MNKENSKGKPKKHKRLNIQDDYIKSLQQEIDNLNKINQDQKNIYENQIEILTNDLLSQDNEFNQAAIQSN